MSKLHISKQLSLPIDAVTQKLAILGRTGSGKSYFATKLCEEMLEAKAQVVALDPVGVWWGLRVGTLKVDHGPPPGYSIPVFGGMHGDVPLEPGGGALIADLIVEKNISAVVDLSNFLLSEQRKFATDFATQLFHRKKTQRSAIHVFFEEAQEFVPQQVRGDVARMVGAFERLIKLGRNFGIGASLISQRPQAVNKDVLNQTECLFAFQMTGPQERKAIESWIREKGLNEDIMTVLPHLKIGQAHVWSPQWLRISKTITIAEKKTADVSCTPKPGAKLIEPAQLSQIELEDLSDKMLATIERAKQEDPKALRAEVAKLKAELIAAGKIVRIEKRDRVEVPVLKDGHLDRLEKLLNRISLNQFEAVMTKAALPILARLAEVDEALLPIREAMTKLALGVPPPARIPVPPPAATRPLPAAPKPAPPRNNNGAEGGVSLGVGERRCGVAIAQHGRVTREQLTVLTGYKRSTRNTYIQRMRAAGLVSEVGDRIAANQELIEWLGPDYEPLPTGPALQSYWVDKLPQGESKVFQCALSSPDGVTRDQIGELTGFKRSTRNTYIQRLAARELVIAKGETIVPSETLFQ
jgi:hypothetical protein